MLFRDTSYVSKIHENSYWQLLVFESDRRLRSNAQVVLDILPQFDAFSNRISAQIKTAANPAFTTALAIGKYAAKVIAEQSKKKQRRHDRHDLYDTEQKSALPAWRKKDNIPDMTHNMLLDYSIFAFENWV